MSAITLESLGLSKDEVTERLIDRLADDLLRSTDYNEDGDEVKTTSQLQQKLREMIRNRVDERVRAIAEEHVIPKVDELIQNIVIAETNRWGETKGTPMTFIEYLVSRADAYMKEEVNHDGKSKTEDGYSWRSAGQRLAFLIDKKLQWAITSPVDQIAKNAQAQIAAAVSSVVQAKLAEMAQTLTVTTGSKR